MSKAIPNNRTITYQHQYRRCGKPTCRCTHGGKPHGPYWYAYWREGDRLQACYVGKQAPQEVRQ